HQDGLIRICLTRKVSDHVILARSITTREILEFDRHTGVALQIFNGSRWHWRIDSVAALPRDIHEIMLDIDRRFQEQEELRAEDPDRRWTPEETHATKDEIRGLLFIDDFYSTR